MSSLDKVLVRKALASGVVRTVTNDANIAIRLRKVTSGTITSVTVVSATSVAIVSSVGGTDTYLFSAYTTIGALADAINADGIMEAKVIDALRSEGSDDAFLAASPVTPGVDENGVVVYDLVQDTSGAETISVCLSPATVNFDMPKGHRVHLREIFYKVNLTAAATGLTIWKRKGTVETELLTRLSVDATDTTVTFASGEGYISGGADEEIIVQLDGAVVDDAGNIVQVVGELE